MISTHPKRGYPFTFLAFYPNFFIFIKLLKITFGAFVICTTFTIIITKNDNDARDVSPAKDEGNYSSGTYLPSNDTCIPSIPVIADTFATNTSSGFGIRRD